MHRPYARIRNAEPSVTTIIGALDKPGLPWAAARETAMRAVYHEDWRDMDPAQAVDLLRRHHRGVWDGRAAVGTLVHAVNERWAAGEDADVDQMIGDALESDRAAAGWRAEPALFADVVHGYLDGLERFWHEWTPEQHEVEAVVRMPGVYVGQRDWRCRMGGRGWLLDLKTTAEQDAEKGIYADSWPLQLAAYNHAPEIVRYAEGDDGRPVEVGTEPNGVAERCGIVHLRGDGHFALYEIDAGRDVFDRFLDLARVHAWRRKPPVPRPITREGA